MVNFTRFILSNGLRVIVHEDQTTPMAVLNILYDVGARDENPQQTGFAHLFEHLMFGGSVNIPHYDEPLQRVGGENNAFTSNDMTNYYITLPADNLETAFWLESDRMLGLAFNEKSLKVQRNVVIEEFKQRYLNQPYGDVWLRLRPLVYKTHPYRWATIGESVEHIEQAEIGDVKAFFEKHYNPKNAIMVVAGRLTAQVVKGMAEKWFGSIPSGKKYQRDLPQEEPQLEARREIILANVPLNAMYIAFQAGERIETSYYITDLISDVLSRGNSSRLHRKLIKEKQLFTEINAYSTSSLDNAMFVIDGKPVAGVDMEVAEAAIWHELNLLINEDIPNDELTKVINKVESTLVFSEINLLDKAMNLAYFELLGDAGLMNLEPENYLRVTADQIRKYAEELFRHENSSTLIYLSAEHATQSPEFQPAVKDVQQD